MKKVLFIDRDGTLIREPEDEQIDSFEKLEFYPKVFQYLSRIAKELDYEIVMITNQDGLGTEVYPEHTFWPVHNFIIKTFKEEGVIFEEQFIDITFAKDNAPTRKPNTGLLTKYFSYDYDLENSFVIGDRLTDIELAKNLGAKGIYINDKKKSYCYKNKKKFILKSSNNNNLKTIKIIGNFHGTLSYEKQRRVIKKFGWSFRLAGFDALNYCLLAEGRVDAVIEANLKPYDILPLIPIIKNSGAIVSNWRNEPAENGGNILATSNRKLHNKILKLLKPFSKK